MGFKDLLRVNEELHKKILCYEPIWIEELKEDLKQYNVNISMQKLMTFLDDKVKYLLKFRILVIFINYKFIYTDFMCQNYYNSNKI